jgi:hypothetical protein
MVPGERAMLRASSEWPFHECLITRDWDQPGVLVQILVSRISPEGGIAAGVFLIDLGALGVKNAMAHYFSQHRDYEDLRSRLTSLMPMKSSDPNLAARIVREGVDYARRLGFSPNRDYPDAALVLQGTEPDAVRTKVPLGVDGKPFYVSGPSDDVARVLRTLEKTVGPGNFESLIAEPLLDID